MSDAWISNSNLQGANRMTKREARKLAKELIISAVLTVEAGSREEGPHFLIDLSDDDYNLVWEIVWPLLARLDK